MSKNITTDQFIEAAKARHGGRFSYLSCAYNGKKNKIKITCKVHGDFATHPDTHLNGKHGGCDKCARTQHGRRSAKRCESKAVGNEVSDFVKYDKDTGKFFWLQNTTIRNTIGKQVGSLTKQGYLECQIQGKRYLLHRLAWFMVYGVWPPDEIDHINCVRTDNRIENLRLASFCQNQQNKGTNSRNTSGVKGVCWDKRTSQWKARVYASRRLVAERRFDNIDEASDWVKDVRIRHHKQFSREE